MFSMIFARLDLSGYDPTSDSTIRMYTIILILSKSIILRQHFPLKTQQTNYDVDQYYSTWTPDHPNNQNAQQETVLPSW